MGNPREFEEVVIEEIGPPARSNGPEALHEEGLLPMRDDDNASVSVFPALGSPHPRICPNCERPMAHRPASQRCCSSRCASEWRKAKRPKTPPPPRFNFVRGATDPSILPDDEDASGTEWGSRGSYWESVIDSVRPSSARSATLTLVGHGALLRVDGNSLVVRNGFTHYPQTRREVRFTPRHPRLPGRVVLLNCDGAVSIPALTWLAQQSVPVVLLDWKGNIAGSLVGEFIASGDPELRRRLDAVTESQCADLARFLIERKLSAQIATVEKFPLSILRAETRHRIEKDVTSLTGAATVDEVRLIEARAALVYFRLWTRLPIRWKGLGRRPVPAEWLSIGLRGSAIGESNRRASHPTNAILNYGYAVLQSQTSIACAMLGLEAGAGVLHARRPRRPSLVLDLMEPTRPLVDAQMVDFLSRHTFSRADFPIGRDGVCRLHPQLARVVAQIATLPTEVVDAEVREFVRNVAPITDGPILVGAASATRSS
jgi:CRISPR-associated protein Cas1